MKNTVIGFCIFFTACTFDASGTDDTMGDCDASRADADRRADAGAAPDASSPADAAVFADATATSDAGSGNGCTITCTDEQAVINGVASWKLLVEGPFLHSLCSYYAPNASSKIKAAGEWNGWSPGQFDWVAYLGESDVHQIYVAKNAGHFNLQLDNAWFDLSGACEWEAEPAHCTIIDEAANTNCRLDENGASILF